MSNPISEFMPIGEAAALLRDPQFSGSVAVRAAFSEGGDTLFMLESSLASRWGAVDGESDPLFTFPYDSAFDKLEGQLKQRQTTLPDELFATVETTGEETATGLYILPLLKAKAVLETAKYSPRHAKQRSGGTTLKLGREMTSKVGANPFYIPNHSSGDGVSISADSILSRAVYNGRTTGHRY